ncbi:MAG: hypothetical protein D6732_22585, partial [Methanobacteriota archaeon]
AKAFRELTPDIIRHLIINTIRSVRVKHGREYGEVVICCDGKNYWRKKYNPYYKSGRKKARDKMPYDMKMIYQTLDELKDELNRYFPYKIIEVEGAEADDVIGTICKELSNSFKILIYSSDKDFYQLQRYPNVSQISPMTKRFVEDDKTPDEYLFEHIIRGDSGDGVTNVFTDIDVLEREGVRQKRITGRFIQMLYNNGAFRMWKEGEDVKYIVEGTGIDPARFELNVLMVDLSMTPPDISEEICSKFRQKKKKPIGGWSSSLLRYFSKHKMKLLVECLDDFLFPLDYGELKIKNSSSTIEIFS